MVFCNEIKNGISKVCRKVTILILIDGFLQLYTTEGEQTDKMVTILILIDGFLQYIGELMGSRNVFRVTILILIDGFLQYEGKFAEKDLNISHNPYFNRWFSAMW